MSMRAEAFASSPSGAGAALTCGQACAVAPAASDRPGAGARCAPGSRMRAIRRLPRVLAAPLPAPAAGTP